MIRIRSTIDDRHNIRNPYGPGQDMAIWTNTMLKERVAKLFQTSAGIRGHAFQIECELNRLAHVRGRSGDTVARAVTTARVIRDSINKAKEASTHIRFNGDIVINIKLLHDRIRF